MAAALLLASAAAVLRLRPPALPRWGVAERSPSRRRGDRFGRAQRRREAAVLAVLPEAVVLLRLSLMAGLSVPEAIASVGPVVPGPVGTAFVQVGDRMRVGWSLVDAIDELRTDLGAVAEPLVGGLRSGLVDGGALGPMLSIFVSELRAMRRRSVETRARRVPVLMLFPLVFCVLPAFVLLAIVPLLVRAVGDVALL